METLRDYTVGECMQMCPEKEIITREKERLLHILEVLPGTENDHEPKADRERMVKSFCRSAVGKSMEEPKNLRPPKVLLRTVNYLLDDVISRKDIPWAMVYEFVMDRLRSVRQDMVIQNLPPAYCISILQPIVRFYAYASYSMCEEHIASFDPVINQTHLQECLKRLLCMYDYYDQISKDSLYLENDFLAENRPFFEAMYVVLNLGNSTAMSRALNLPKKWRTDLVEMAFRLSLCCTNHNFVRASRIIKTLPLLLLMMASQHLPELRRNALKVMSVAYSNKNITFPVNILKKLLLYDSEHQLISECKYYGLDIRDNGVCFLKKSFKADKEIVPATHQQFINEKIVDIDVSTLILFSD